MTLNSKKKNREKKSPSGVLLSVLIFFMQPSSQENKALQQLLQMKSDRRTMGIIVQLYIQ